MAAAVITVTESTHTPVKKIKWTWTSSDAGAASLVTTNSYYGQVLALVTDPDGVSAPTDDYDITITDSEGYDVMQAAGANRDTANTETATPTATSVAHGVLTINITNAGDTKKGTAVLYIR